VVRSQTARRAPTPIQPKVRNKPLKSKTLRFRGTIAEADVQVKVQQLERFLERGYSVTVEVDSRVSDRHDPELARVVLDNIVQRVLHVAVVTMPPSIFQGVVNCVLMPISMVKTSKRRSYPGSHQDDDDDDNATAAAADDDDDDDFDDEYNHNHNDNHNDNDELGKGRDKKKSSGEAAIEHDLLPNDRKKQRAAKNEAKRIAREQREQQQQLEAKKQAKSAHDKQRIIQSAMDSVTRSRFENVQVFDESDTNIRRNPWQGDALHSVYARSSAAASASPPLSSSGRAAVPLKSPTSNAQQVSGNSTAALLSNLVQTALRRSPTQDVPKKLPFENLKKPQDQSAAASSTTNTPPSSTTSVANKKTLDELLARVLKK
jgi:hypothetical protein